MLIEQKTTVHTVRFSGECSTFKENFGEKFTIFTINKDEFTDSDAIRAVSQYKRGMRNPHLIVVQGSLKESLDEGTRCKLTFSVDDIIYDEKFLSYCIKAKKIEKLYEITNAGFIRYLSLKFKGVGAKTGEKIYNAIISLIPSSEHNKVLEYFEEYIIAEQPDIVKATGKKKAMELKNILTEAKITKENTIELNEDELTFSASYDISPKFLLRLKKQIISASTKQFKNADGSTSYTQHNTIPYLKNEPYLLALDDQIKGMGFKTIDSKVLSFSSQEVLSSERFVNQRTLGFTKFCLIKENGNGHLYLPIPTIQKMFKKQNEGASADAFFEIAELELDEFNNFLLSIIFEIPDDINPFIVFEQRIYLKENFALEIAIGKKFDGFKSKTIAKLEFDPLLALLSIEASENITLSDEQRNAVINSLKNPVSVITGGPGTGKTTISNMVIKLLKKTGKSIKILAPTGTAAKRISTIVGETATTIHRGLGFKGKFEFNSFNPLPFDVVIIDESSMIDAWLGHALISACANSQVIFIGDVNQLPSVGAGDFLRDVINSEQFFVSKLTNVFRQAGDNPIVQFAYAVNRGDGFDKFFPWLTKKDDILEHKLAIPFFNEFKKTIKKEGEEPVENPEYLNNMTMAAARYGLKSYLVKGETLFDTQILVSNNKSNRTINSLLQKQLNVHGKDVRDSGFKIGDKIIQTKNNYKHNIFNGSIGIIRHFDESSDIVSVEYLENQGSLFSLPFDVLKRENALCYAMTIHKSQGQEFKRVIMLNNDYMLNNREMLYTGSTRAKSNLIIVTNALLLTMGINTTNQKVRGEKAGKQARFTTLLDFLQMDKTALEELESKYLKIPKKNQATQNIVGADFDD